MLTPTFNLNVILGFETRRGYVCGTGLDAGHLSSVIFFLSFSHEVEIRPLFSLAKSAEGDTARQNGVFWYLAILDDVRTYV